jgi:hypothetical protein
MALEPVANLRSKEDATVTSPEVTVAEDPPDPTAQSSSASDTPGKEVAMVKSPEVTAAEDPPDPTLRSSSGGGTPGNEDAMVTVPKSQVPKILRTRW